MISNLDAVLLVAAGLLAGLVGTAGGITSLVSYPALLAVGLPAVSAGVANNLALVACWPGSAAASRPELRGRGRWLRRWTAVSAAGGAAGAAILLRTPPGVFERVVPFLVAAGSLMLVLEPRLTARRRRATGDEPTRADGRQCGWGAGDVRRDGGARGDEGADGRRAGRAVVGAGARRLALPTGAVGLALYNGYFGAGAGVMTLTLMLVLVEPHLPTANALKNMLVGAASLTCAAVLIVAGPVPWAAVLPLALGMLLGAALGPRVARRLPVRVLRPLVVTLGLALAVQLWLRGAG